MYREGLGPAGSSSPNGAQGSATEDSEDVLQAPLPLCPCACSPPMPPGTAVSSTLRHDPRVLLRSRPRKSDRYGRAQALEKEMQTSVVHWNGVPTDKRSN